MEEAIAAYDAALRRYDAVHGEPSAEFADEAWDANVEVAEHAQAKAPRFGFCVVAIQNCGSASRRT